MLAGEIRETTLREAEWRRLTLAIGIGLALLPATLYAQSIPGALPESAKALSQGDWPAYAGTYLNNFDPHLWVYDKASGETLAEVALPANATGAPITYMAGGKQFIVFPVGGGPLVEEMIAVAL
jgi:hypothetical protein